MIREIPNYRARRWVVERTHYCMNRFRRILIRCEKKPENYLALCHLVCACITIRSIQVSGQAFRMHCHNLVHEDHDTMGQFEVMRHRDSDPPTYGPLKTSYSRGNG